MFGRFSFLRSSDTHSICFSCRVAVHDMELFEHCFYLTLGCCRVLFHLSVFFKIFLHPAITIFTYSNPLWAELPVELNRESLGRHLWSKAQDGGQEVQTSPGNCFALSASSFCELCLCFRGE